MFANGPRGRRISVSSPLRWGLVTLGVLLWLAAPPSAARQRNRVLIGVVGHDSATHKTRDLLRQLLNTHDVDTYTFTRSVMIDASAIPHSHPRLTLHTRHQNDPELLLSTYLHEQFHWHLDAHRAQTQAAVADLKARFPVVPVGFPEGAKSASSSYEHLLVNALEMRAVRATMGELRAQQVLAFWCNDHYTALYRIVRDHGADITAILAKHKLLVDAPATHDDPADAK